MWLLWVTLAIVAITALLGAQTWLAHDPWALVELRKLKRSTIATAFGDCEVRLVGIVRAIGASSSDGVVVQHTVTEELQRHHRVAETTWVRTGDDLDAQDFWLDDGTGRALVIARGVRPLFVASRYAAATELGDRRSFEAVVMDGDRIAVCGHATWDEGHGETALAGDAAPEIAGRHLVIGARERSPIVISDDPALLAEV